MSSQNSINNTSSSVKTLIMNNMRYFECILMLTIMKDVTFWKEFCKNKLNAKANPYNRNSLKFNDFSNTIDNTIYAVINDLYESLADLPEIEVKADIKMLSGMFEAKVKEGTMSLDESLPIKRRLTELNDMANAEGEGNISESFVKLGFTEWLNLRRVKQTLAFNLSANNVDADDIIQSLKDSTTSIDNNSVEMEDIITAVYQSDPSGEENVAERMPMCNLPILSQALGGGPLRGECGLGIGLSGSGKTVLAGQMASGFALSKYKTCYITTEQRSFMIIPRMVSANLNIKFDKIKNGIKSAFVLYETFKNTPRDELPEVIKPVLLTKFEKESIEEFLITLNPYMKFENWSTKGLLIVDDLERTVQSYKEKFDLDVLVLDWIGGGVQIDDKSHRPDIYYRNVADLIKTISQEYNIFIYALAQASDSATDKAFISSTDIDQCKKMDVPFTFAMGVTAMFSEEFRLSENRRRKRGSNMGNTVKETMATYNRYQNMCIWKNRMDPASVYPMERDFAYQRFNEYKSIPCIADMPTQKLQLNPTALQGMPTV